MFAVARGLPKAGPHPHRWSPARSALDGTFEVTSNPLLYYRVVALPRYPLCSLNRVFVQVGYRVLCSAL
jgi:hypothetical protein